MQILPLISCVRGFSGFASEQHLASPDGKIIIMVSDDGGLRYRVEVDGQPLLKQSWLGLEFTGGVTLGLNAKIEKAQQSHHDGIWENHFGKRSIARDCWNQLQLTLVESDQPQRRFGMILRAYDDGVALRYDLSKGPGLEEFVLNRELTEFAFADDYRCWAGDQSSCAESQYLERTLSTIPQHYDLKDGKSERYKGVLPLLVQAPQCYAAVAESNLLDWAGMFITGTGSSTVLASRGDGNGCVVSEAPRVSPWRVLIMARAAGDLVSSELIANLATPSQTSNTSWIKPGISAWDPWWTDIDPHLPEIRGVSSRGDTLADQDYIDLAADMGWSYQVVDWLWYQNCTSYDIALNVGGKNPERPPVDFSKASSGVDMPALLAHAKERGVRLILWLHSYDLERHGIEKASKLFSDWGVAGLKIDFMNSDSQETVAWHERVIKLKLAPAAGYAAMLSKAKQLLKAFQPKILESNL